MACLASFTKTMQLGWIKVAWHHTTETMWHNEMQGSGNFKITKNVLRLITQNQDLFFYLAVVLLQIIYSFASKSSHMAKIWAFNPC